MSYTAVSHEVRSMFGSIAERYDLTNSVLSLGIHHGWRRALINLLPASSNQLVLDLCTGTGDLLPLLRKRFSSVAGSVIGADFCMPMLVAGKRKFTRTGQSTFAMAQADGLSPHHCQPIKDRAPLGVSVPLSGPVRLARN